MRKLRSREMKCIHCSSEIRKQKLSGYLSKGYQRGLGVSRIIRRQDLGSVSRNIHTIDWTTRPATSTCGKVGNQGPIMRTSDLRNTHLHCHPGTRRGHQGCCFSVLSAPRVVCLPTHPQSQWLVSSPLPGRRTAESMIIWPHLISLPSQIIFKHICLVEWKTHLNPWRCKWVGHFSILAFEIQEEAWMDVSWAHLWFHALTNFSKMTQEWCHQDLKPDCLVPEFKFCKFYHLSRSSRLAWLAPPWHVFSMLSSFGRSTTYPSVCMVHMGASSPRLWTWGGWDWWSPSTLDYPHLSYVGWLNEFPSDPTVPYNKPPQTSVTEDNKYLVLLISSGE